MLLNSNCSLEIDRELLPVHHRIQLKEPFMERFPLVWQNVQNMGNIRYKCGYCGTDTTPSRGWSTNAIGGHRGFVLICTYCNRPSFVEVFGGRVERTTPATRMGEEITGLPEELQALYDEARQCTSVGAYTSAVLTCRKILMHIAVEKGAEEGKRFIEYVNYLAQNNYIPRDGREWVDYIRTKANEANHEILIMNAKDAEDLIAFTEMLLRLVYEFKYRLRSQRDSA